jgi:cytochrome P450
MNNPRSAGCPVARSEPTPDWDPLDPANNGDPTSVHAQLREKCPVAWTDRFGGFYTLTRYADVTAAASDIARRSNPIPPSTPATAKC